LKKENVNVLTAKTGEEALAALEKQKPDLVWLDILLPGINGIEVLRNIRNNPLLKDLKAVVVSVSAGDDKIKEARTLNASGYIIKSENTLESIIKRVLSYIN
ncbi:MAG: response regulator, partial [Patescibacteria group bacterium]